MSVVVTISGRLTSDPKLRFLNSGDAVASFSVASNDRKYDKATGQWIDGETTFIDVSAFKALGEGAADSLSKGDLVFVTGKGRQRSYETKAGEKRTVFEVTADEIGKSVRARKTLQAPQQQEMPEW